MKEPAVVLQFQIESIIFHTSKFVTNYFNKNHSKTPIFDYVSFWFVFGGGVAAVWRWLRRHPNNFFAFFKVSGIFVQPKSAFARIVRMPFK